MAEKNKEEKQLVKIEEVSLERMSLEQKRRAEQLYHQLGLDPVVNKVLKDLPKSLSRFDRVTDKMFGPYDIKGRAEAVAKVTALITYAALSEEYHKEVGKLESQITSLEGERDQVGTNYDNLVQKVADIVGGDYDELKANYNELMGKLAEVEHLRSQVADLNKERAQLVERVAKILGEDYEELKTSYNKLVEKLAGIEHLRSQLEALSREKEQLIESYESQIADRDSKMRELDSEKAVLGAELQGLKAKHEQLSVAVTTLAKTIPYDEIREKLGQELYAFLLKDSKVPDMVIDGVGKFIDFKKYLGMAAQKGAEEAASHAEETLRNAVTE